MWWTTTVWGPPYEPGGALGAVRADVDMGRRGVLPVGGGLQDLPGRAGADQLDHAGAGGDPLHPHRAGRGGDALGSAAVDAGGRVRRTGDGDGAGGGADPQCLAGAGRVGLLRPPGQSLGPGLPAVCGNLVGAVPGVYPGV